MEQNKFKAHKGIIFATSSKHKVFSLLKPSDTAAYPRDLCVQMPKAHYRIFIAMWPVSSLLSLRNLCSQYTDMKGMGILLQPQLNTPQPAI